MLKPNTYIDVYLTQQTKMEEKIYPIYDIGEEKG